MKQLILYSTIVGGFYAQSEALDAVIYTARTEAGEDNWKRGFSGNSAKGATAIAKRHLKAANIQPVTVSGRLVHVGFVQNQDATGNVYPKLRVGVEADNGDRMMLSLDMKSDVAQRLIVKLDNCFPDQYVTISAWPTTVERSGRLFINHALSMKDFNGKEIPSNSEFSQAVKLKCAEIEPLMVSNGLTDKKIIATAKATKRVELHKMLLLNIQSVFTAETQSQD